AFGLAGRHQRAGDVADDDRLFAPAVRVMDGGQAVTVGGDDDRTLLRVRFDTDTVEVVPNIVLRSVKLDSGEVLRIDAGEVVHADTSARPPGSLVFASPSKIGRIW